MAERGRRSGFLSTLLFVLCAVVFCVAAWKLWGYWKNYHEGEKEYEQLREFVKEKSETEERKTREKDGDRCPVTVDFAALSEINSDVRAWIYIEGTGINYPVVQTTDNSYYLHHTFEKRDSFVGAIFLDAGCESDFSSDNSILYGHNLKNGAMFGGLKRNYDIEYNEDADYRNYQKIWIVTPSEEIEYQIFAAREINVDEDKDVYMIEFAGMDEKAAYIKTAIEKSQYTVGVEPDEEKALLTLSTCTSSTEAGRFILQAAEIQKNERKLE